MIQGQNFEVKNTFKENYDQDSEFENSYEKQYQNSGQKDQVFREFQILLEKGFYEIKQDQYKEGLDKVEMAILKMKQLKQEEIFNQNFTDIITALNKEAVKSLNIQKFEKSKAILYKCDSLTQLHKFGLFYSLRVLTLNNHGCYFRRNSDNQMALQYFQNALKILEESNTIEHLGITRLNLCAVFSSIQEFKTALYNADEAIFHLEEDIKYILQENIDLDELQQIPEFIEIAQNLAISYYNKGVAEEHFEDLEKALKSYQNALNVSEAYLGLDHHITKKFKLILNQFQEKQPSKNLQKTRQLSAKQIKNNKNQIINNKLKPFVASYSVKQSNYVIKGNQVTMKSKRVQSSSLQRNLQTPSTFILPKSIQNYGNSQQMQQKPQVMSKNRPQSAGCRRLNQQSSFVKEGNSSIQPIQEISSFAKNDFDISWDENIQENFTETKQIQQNKHNMGSFQQQSSKEDRPKMIKILERKQLNSDLLVYLDPSKYKLIMTIINAKKQLQFIVNLDTQIQQFFEHDPKQKNFLFQMKEISQKLINNKFKNTKALQIVNSKNEKRFADIQKVRENVFKMFILL